MTHIHAVIFDVDGTLVDSNDAQARSWVDALKEFGYSVPFEKVRPLIGMGGDKVLPETIDVQKNSEKGKQISKRRSEIFKEKYLPTIQAFPGAQELLDRMREQGLKLAIASSAQPDELRSLLQIVGAADLIEDKTSSEDAKRSKPDPDIMQVTLKKVGYPLKRPGKLALGQSPSVAAVGATPTWQEPSPFITTRLICWHTMTVPR